jgi:hypothetical protein
MTEKEIDEDGISKDDKKNFTTVKDFYSGGVKTESMNDAVSKQGKKYYSRTESAISGISSTDTMQDGVGGVWSIKDFKEQQSEGPCSRKIKRTIRDLIREEHPKQVMLMPPGDGRYEEFMRQQA